MCNATAATVKFCLVIIYNCTSIHLIKIDFSE